METLLSLLPPHELRQVSVGQMEMAAPPHRVTAQHKWGTRYSTQHSTSSNSCLAPLPFSRQTLTSISCHLKAHSGGDAGLGQEQMTQVGHRWDTTGQAGRPRSLRRPSLTVILGVKTVGTPLWAVCVCWRGGFLLFLTGCRITVLLPQPEEDHRQELLQLKSLHVSKLSLLNPLKSQTTFTWKTNRIGFEITMIYGETNYHFSEAGIARCPF